MDSGDLKQKLRGARRGGRRGYPKELRGAVLEFASRAKAAGKSDAQIAAELGVSAHTLQYWRAAQRRTGQLRPVAIVDEPAPAREVVVEWRQLRIRGLSLADVAALLGRLG